MPILQRLLAARDMDWAISCGLGPLLHATARDSVPTSGRRRLEAADRLARLQYADQLDAALEVLDACAAVAKAPTLLKGLSISQTHYPEPHWRLMGDVDLLVTASERPRVEAVLRDRGWPEAPAVAGMDYASHHHARPRHHPETGVCVEVHSALLPASRGLSRAAPFRPEVVRAEHRPATLRGRDVHHLSPELQLVYGAVHWAEGFRPEACARALLDAAQLARGRDLDWDRVLGWLDDRRVAAAVELLLVSLQETGLLEPPARVLADRRLRVLGRRALRWLRALVDRHGLAGEPLRFGPHVTARVWQTLLEHPGPAAWPRLVWNLALPPGHPDRFRPTYHWRRLRSARRRL